MVDQGSNDGGFSLEGRVALVTGGGRGIGEGICMGFARAGADLVVAARSADEIDRVAAAAQALGRRGHRGSDRRGRSRFAGPVVRSRAREYGRLDILANCAGVNVRKPALEVLPEDWDRVHNINLRGMFFACQHALRMMDGGEYGRIINIASLAAFIGINPLTVYTASKGGVGQLTKALAIEFATQPITVNAIAPGYIHTEMDQTGVRASGARSLGYEQDSGRQVGLAGRHCGDGGLFGVSGCGLRYRPSAGGRRRVACRLAVRSETGRSTIRVELV